MSVRPVVQFWLWISVFATLAGWTLSVFGELNRVGYTVAFAFFAGFIVLQRRSLGFSRGFVSLTLRKAVRRFRRPLPFCFFVLAVLVFAGGLMYRPTHYVALTYHIPRVLQWLAAGRWIWIHTAVVRMNYTGCDFEWQFAPLVLFTKSDRLIFILNFIPYLFLPGLVFSVFTRLGMHPRVARQWMWLLPTGYNFLLQAGSTGNDSISAFYALAAFDFGLRARTAAPPALTLPRGATASVALSNLWHSILAAGLLTGTKPVSVPLLLPWLILIWPSARLLARHWFATLPVVAAGAVASFFPLALMNRLHCGDWMGMSIEPGRVEVRNPLAGIVCNGFELLQSNLAPPLFPMARAWDSEVARFIPHNWAGTFQNGFFSTGELPTEDWAGIGFGLSVLLAVSVVAGLLKSKSVSSSSSSSFSSSAVAAAPPRRDIVRDLVLVGPWAALLIYCAKAGMATPARLIAPYYPLLLPLLLIGRAQAEMVRQAWWRTLVRVVIFLAFLVLIVSPDRPLWPAQTVLSRLAERHPNNHLVSRAREVYAIYAKRSDPLANVRALLPPGVKVVGFLADEDDCDISFWLPFGSRRVEHFLLTDPPERFRQEGVTYVVVDGATVLPGGLTVSDWMKTTGAQLIGETNDTLKVSEGERTWMVVKIN
ncbi:MAG TPA: hypothetical protein VMF08_01535 [Candidatus Sulfotelmatobacter sp.]|nr:hypothetical protein [Candidatus Sulfotelmatobacter sp.]